MFCKKFVLLAVVVLCLPLLASAQMGRWETEEPEDIDALIDAGRMRPFVEASYGVSTPDFKGMDGSFAGLGLLELKLGYSGIDSVNGSVVSLDERYSFGSYMGEDIGGSPAAGEDVARLSRFGFGNRLGSGWAGKSMSFLMYSQNSLNWTSVHAGDYDSASPDAQAIYDRYGTQFRFGQLMEAGVRFNLSRRIGFTAGAEGAVIFPRHVFWPWLGSAMIYSGVEGALEYFSEEIINTSPVVGPILHFLLKNGAALGYYLLLQDDMAWPFDYEQPLTVASYKLGATITF